MSVNGEILKGTQKSISQMAKNINAAYQETKEERIKINAWEWENNFDFTILGLIELYTSYVCGYASQIAIKGHVQDTQEAITHLQKIQFFDKPYFVNWFFSEDNEYVKVKEYVNKLNYLRLSALEYIAFYNNSYNESPTSLMPAATR